MTRFRWTELAEKAAVMVARDELTNEEIAEACQVTRDGLQKWKRHPDFTARVEEHVAAYRATVRRRGIAILERRVDALNDRWERMRQVIEARAVAYAEDDHGGETGLLRRTVRWEGKGEDARAVFDYEFDAALVKELREHEKQAAQELGQWTEKHQVESEVSLVEQKRQRAMIRSERAFQLASDLEREIIDADAPDAGDDPGGIRLPGQ